MTTGGRITTRARCGSSSARFGWQDAKTDLDLALTAADNTLEGTQTLPLSFLADDRQAYTWPDSTDNRLALATLKGSRFLSSAVLLGGNAYYRSYRSASLDSNVNGDRNTYGDGYSDCHPDGYEYINGYSNCDRHGNGHRYTNDYTDGDEYRN